MPDKAPNRLITVLNVLVVMDDALSGLVKAIRDALAKLSG